LSSGIGGNFQLFWNGVLGIYDTFHSSSQLAHSNKSFEKSNAS
jgi:hypothetical protein